MDEDQLEMELAIADRVMMGLVPIGPLMEQDQFNVDARERWYEEAAAEEEARLAAGGRTVCPECNQRKMVWKTVCTYGYWGHPGADYSDYGRCENCGHQEL